MPYIGRSTEAFGVRTRYTYTPSAGDTSVSGADVNGLSLSFTDVSNTSDSAPECPNNLAFNRKFLHFS